MCLRAADSSITTKQRSICRSVRMVSMAGFTEMEMSMSYPWALMKPLAIKLSSEMRSFRNIGAQLILSQY